jgi:hypothetical protein
VNNSLDRLLNGIAEALRRDVIPRLEDEYATGQALAVIDLINTLKLRLDWAVPPLLERAVAQQTLMAELQELLGDLPDFPMTGQPLSPLPIDGRSLQGLCDRLDGLIGATVRWIGARPPGPCQPTQKAQAAISRHVHAELRRDMALTARPLFAEIARGNDASKPLT